MLFVIGRACIPKRWNRGIAFAETPLCASDAEEESVVEMKRKSAGARVLTRNIAKGCKRREEGEENACKCW
jgi:hypothetical protein